MNPEVAEEKGPRTPGNTVRFALMFDGALLPFVTVTFTVYSPIEVGVQEKLLEFWLAQPGGSPTYAYV
jgi:hypothetical protein